MASRDFLKRLRDECIGKEKWVYVCQWRPIHRGVAVPTLRDRRDAHPWAYRRIARHNTHISPRVHIYVFFATGFFFFDLLVFFRRTEVTLFTTLRAVFFLDAAPRPEDVFLFLRLVAFLAFTAIFRTALGLLAVFFAEEASRFTCFFTALRLVVLFFLGGIENAWLIILFFKK